jgi:hypothetical protein
MCGPRGRVPASQAQDPEFKLQNLKKNVTSFIFIKKK